MAEPRYQPAPRQRPSPYGVRPQRSRRTRKQAAPAPFVPQGGNAAVQAPQQQDDKWWKEAPVDQSPPQQDAKQDKWWTEAPAVQEKEPTFYEEYVQPTGEAIAGAGQAVKDWAVGKHDPRFKGLPSIDEPEVAVDAGLQLGPLNSAKVTGFSDEAYRDIIRKQLGDRYLGEEQDENGFIVLHYRGHDGKPASAYVNKPGVDYRDIDRGVNASLPYMVGGGIAGRVTQGVNLAGRAAAQFMAGGSASVAQDYAAQQMGSEQNPQTMGIDPWKAVIAGVGGAAGEYIGAFIGNLIRKGQFDKTLYDTATGRLTESGRRLAQEKGVDPDLIEGELAKEFARMAAQADNPGEALMKVQSDRFGIPSTKGQRSGDPQYLLTEKDIRYGNLGRDAAQRMREFDKYQVTATQRAARGSIDRKANDPVAPLRGLNEAEAHGVAPMLAPHRVFLDQRPDVLGKDGIQKGFNKASEVAHGVENLAWRKVGPIRPRESAKQRLPDFVSKGLKGEKPDRELHPWSSRMLDEIIAFREGNMAKGDFSDFLGTEAVRDLDQMRRLMLQYMRSSNPGDDKRLAGKIYGKFNEGLLDLEANGLLAGDVKGVMKMREAMDVTKYIKGMMKPIDKRGKETAAGRILNKVADAETGEEVINSLLGAAGPKGSFPRDGVKALEQYKHLVHKFGGKIGRQAWNDVRLAYWLKLITGKDGEMLGPQAIKTNIETAMHHQRSAFDVLYTVMDQRQIRRFLQALKTVTYKDPNPSGSGTVARGMLPEMVASQADILASREKFKLSTGSGNPVLNRLMVQIWRGISKKVRSPIRTDQFAVNRVTSQSLTRKPNASLGGYGSTGLANALAERRQPQR